MPTSDADLLAAAYADADRTIDLRRRLHRNPEIGLHLPVTQATVLEALADLPVEVTTGKSTTSVVGVLRGARPGPTYLLRAEDRKSTRLNSSHANISYAVFCLKKKTK